MKHLPIGRQSFEEIIKEDLLYIDKTRHIHHLIQSGKLYFLSRPRRFGKSLLISTFRYLFSGKKELFKNLYIGKKTDFPFIEYPILQFNFADFGLKNQNFEEELSQQLDIYAKAFDVETSTISISTQFKTLVQGISAKGKPVVILIDEYDKPIVDFLTETEKAKKKSTNIKAFLWPLKGLEAQGHLKFLFITGVSKFSKVSLFSDLNNLTDLSIHTLSHDLLGITHKELLANFQTHIESVTNHFNTTQDILLQNIKRWYNGYSYDGKTKLYNPFSVLNFFQNHHFSNYWFATGTPTFLVETIRNRGIKPQEFDEVEVDDAFFFKFSLEDIDMIGLLFQTGYLTIKTAQKGMFESRYFLGYPNLEVRKSMMHNLAEAFTFKPASNASNSLLKMERGLRTGNLPLFITQLKSILSNIKYNWQPPRPYKTEAELFKMWEGYFHAILYIITSYMEMFVQAEIQTNKGRIDLIAQTNDFLYLMEFKLDESGKTAMEQIKNREYVAPYLNSPKTIYLVGINFSKEERNVENYEAEIWKRD